MEFKSSSSIVRKTFPNIKNLKSASIFTELIDKYSKISQEQIDPTQLQKGQSVFDNTGEEFIVVENQDGSKVLMPKSQQGNPIPEVETVEDTEITTSYGVQPINPSGVQMAETANKEKRAQEEYEGEQFVDWDDITSVVRDLIAFTKQKNIQGLTSSVEELTNIILSYMEIPGDLNIGPMFARIIGKYISVKAKKTASSVVFNKIPTNVSFTKKKAKGSQGKNISRSVKVLPEFVNIKNASGIKIKAEEITRFKNTKSRFKDFKSQYKKAQAPETSVFPDVTSFHEPVKADPEFNSKFKKDDEGKNNIGLGEPGFVDVMNDISKMVEEGYEVVDVILSIGEKFPREQGTKVLEEAREKGIL